MSCFERCDLARRGREARRWLARDGRGRTIGLIVLSLTISVALSLTATAIVGAVARRRAAAVIHPTTPDDGGPTAVAVPAPDEVAGVSAPETESSIAEDGPAQAAGA
jgi:hypothetical protein